MLETTLWEALFQKENSGSRGWIEQKGAWQPLGSVSGYSQAWALLACVSPSEVGEQSILWRQKASQAHRLSLSSLGYHLISWFICFDALQDSQENHPWTLEFTPLDTSPQKNKDGDESMGQELGWHRMGLQVGRTERLHSLVTELSLLPDSLAPDKSQFLMVFFSLVDPKRPDVSESKEGGRLGLW